MNERITKAINGYGPALRLITPIMTLLISTLLALILSDVKEVKSDLKSYQAQVNTLDTRVAVIEANRFTSKDGHNIMEMILQKLPPKWLTDKVSENERIIKSIRNGE